MICYEISTCYFTNLNPFDILIYMDKTPLKIEQMFNNIARMYDFNNNIMSFGQHIRIKKKAVKYLKAKNTKVLDVCTGTGDIAGFFDKSCDVTGIDFSEKMLEIANKKYPWVEFTKADCTNLPFKDNTFDIVTISFGLRNIENYSKALDEIYRVLKPNGIFMHLDFGKKNFLGDCLFDLIIPHLVKIFYKNILPYEYLVKSKQLFFNENALIGLFKEHNLHLKEKHTMLFGGASCQICQKL